jgi:hypothetical protein
MKREKRVRWEISNCNHVRYGAALGKGGQTKLADIETPAEFRNSPFGLITSKSLCDWHLDINAQECMEHIKKLFIETQPPTRVEELDRRLGYCDSPGVNRREK